MTNEEVYAILETNRAQLGTAYEILLIMFRGGFRVSEVLNMSHSNIIGDTDVYIIASKNSRSKRIHVPELSKQLIKYKTFAITPFKGYSRFQIYRICKRLGLVIDNGANKNKSVTHSMRKMYIRESYNSSGSLIVAAEIVGHKSVKSTQHYVEKKESKTT